MRGGVYMLVGAENECGSYGCGWEALFYTRRFLTLSVHGAFRELVVFCLFRWS